MSARRTWALPLLVLTFAGQASAQQEASPEARLDEVIALAESGFSEEEVVAHVQETGGIGRPLTAQEVSRLGAAGLGEPTIRALSLGQGRPSGGVTRVRPHSCNGWQDSGLWVRLPVGWECRTQQGTVGFIHAPREALEKSGACAVPRIRIELLDAGIIWEDDALLDDPGLPVEGSARHTFAKFGLEGFSYELVEPAPRRTRDRYGSGRGKDVPTKGCFLVWALQLSRYRWWLAVAATTPERLAEDRPVLEGIVASLRPGPLEATLSFVEDLVAETSAAEALEALAGVEKVLLEEKDVARLARAGAAPEVIAAISAPPPRPEAPSSQESEPITGHESKGGGYRVVLPWGWAHVTGQDSDWMVAFPPAPPEGEAPRYAAFLFAGVVGNSVEPVPPADAAKNAAENARRSVGPLYRVQFRPAPAPARLAFEVAGREAWGTRITSQHGTLVFDVIWTRGEVIEAIVVHGGTAPALEVFGPVLEKCLATLELCEEGLDRAGCLAARGRWRSDNGEELTLLPSLVLRRDEPGEPPRRGYGRWVAGPSEVLLALPDGRCERVAIGDDTLALAGTTWRRVAR